MKFFLRASTCFHFVDVSLIFKCASKNVKSECGKQMFMLLTVTLSELIMGCEIPSVANLCFFSYFVYYTLVQSQTCLLRGGSTICVNIYLLAPSGG